jgi:hypothetical protein
MREIYSSENDGDDDDDDDDSLPKRSTHIHTHTQRDLPSFFFITLARSHLFFSFVFPFGSETNIIYAHTSSGWRAEMI